MWTRSSPWRSSPWTMPLNAVDRLRSLKADTLIHVFPQRDIARWGKRAGIPHRIGTSHRLLALDHVQRTRVRSAVAKAILHEAQLNTKLLAPLGVDSLPSLSSLKALVRVRRTDTGRGCTHVAATGPDQCGTAPGFTRQRSGMGIVQLCYPHAYARPSGIPVHRNRDSYRSAMDMRRTCLWTCPMWWTPADPFP